MQWGILNFLINRKNRNKNEFEKLKKFIKGGGGKENKVR